MQPLETISSSSASENSNLEHLVVPGVMDNFEVDPRPLVPRGFRLVQWPPAVALLQQQDCPRVFLGDWPKAQHEAVATEDFFSMAVALHDYLIHQCHAHYVRVEECSIGSAIVTFHSGLECEGILIGNPHVIGPYNVTFVKHGEGPNVRDLLLDRFAWLMLIGFPLDFVPWRKLCQVLGFWFTGMLKLHFLEW